MSSCDYDIIIAGAGITGLTLACALVREAPALRLGLLDRRSDEPECDTPDSRVLALTRASERILTNLGIWRELPETRLSPFREMFVWDAGGRGQIRFDSARLGEAQLGWIVENNLLQAMLWRKARLSEAIDIRQPVELLHIRHDDGQLAVQLKDSRSGTLQSLSTRLLIGADGARSTVRELAAIRHVTKDYGQTALVTAVQTEYPHCETAWQRFLPGGPLAFLPLRDGRSSIVWSTGAEHAQQLLAMESDDFKHTLADHFDHRLGAILAMEQRLSFPLYLQRVDTYIKPRVALAGDAAHVVHPLAGQGANLGLLDAACLAEVIGRCHTAGRDIGGLSALRRYERWRKGENLLMMLALDSFKHLFGNEFTPLQLIRNAGLNLTDAATPLKTLIMQRAMGLSGDLPQLARLVQR